MDVDKSGLEIASLVLSQLCEYSKTASGPQLGEHMVTYLGALDITPVCFYFLQLLGNVGWISLQSSVAESGI